MWGFATSHLVTEGPIVTGGFVGGDIGGNMTISFKAVGGVGKHSIRAYVGTRDTPPVPYLPCIIGGEVEFNIIGPSLDTQTILNRLNSLNATILSVQGNTVTIKTNLGIINGTITTINNGVATVQTDLGTLTLSVNGVKGSTDSTVNYGLGALALSVIDLIILLAVVFLVLRKH